MEDFSHKERLDFEEIVAKEDKQTEEDQLDSNDPEKNESKSLKKNKAHKDLLEESPITEGNSDIISNGEKNLLDSNDSSPNISTLSEVPVSISVVLGSTKVALGKVLKFQKGSVLELDQKIGEFVQIFVNNKLIARGEIVVVEDKIGVSIVEIIK